MKIILSPSKTQSESEVQVGLENPKYYVFAKQIIKEIKNYNRDDLSKMMNIKGKLLEETYRLYKEFKVNRKELIPVIKLYKGVVYNCFNHDDFSENEINYLNEHIRIISALYGVLKPNDGVQAYRLDFTMKLNEDSLTQFWKKKLVKYFKNEALILDCASLEFSHLLSPLKEKVHRIEFIDCIDGQEKIISYNVKKLRGLMAHYCIKHQVEQIEQIQDFNEEGYHYQAHRSDASKSVFIRFSSSIQR